MSTGINICKNKAGRSQTFPYSSPLVLYPSSDRYRATPKETPCHLHQKRLHYALAVTVMMSSPNSDTVVVSGEAGETLTAPGQNPARLRTKASPQRCASHHQSRRHREKGLRESVSFEFINAIRIVTSVRLCPLLLLRLRVPYYPS